MQSRVCHPCSELEFHDWRGVLDTTLYDGDRSVVFHFPPPNKTEHQDIAEIVLE